MRKVLLWTAAALWVGDRITKALRGQTSPFTYDPGVFGRIYANIAIKIDQSIGWPQLPPYFGLAVLLGERVKMRADNLVDTSQFATTTQPDPQATGTSYLTQRTIDGAFNDLRHPTMGMTQQRFGRNVPNEFTWPDPEPLIMSPNPRDVSRALLTRSEFTPATTLNALAAAWIQFMTRDWFSHGSGDIKKAWQIPLPQGDDFPQNPMLVPRTVPDPTRPADDTKDPPTHINFETPWWDASQIYPSDPKILASVRTGSGGKLLLVPHGDDLLLPPPLLEQLAAVPGWWLGLGLLLTLFAREHNAICDRVAAEHPGWSDDQLFQKARLINAALLAKIHTVEWSPAIIAHPTSVMALRGNWWGVFGPKLNPIVRRFTNIDLLIGIPGSPTNQHSAPYSLTEEFVAVYRMHPLMRDEFSFRRATDDSQIEQRDFPDVADKHGNELLQNAATTDLLYSFGTLYPGALQLHNYPKFLQHFTRPDGKVADLGSIDILRMREFGVPRYTVFRELLHLRPLNSFDEVTTNPTWAREMRDVYEGRLDRLDLMVGMFAEPKPWGFGFSDTAFRIFILMASRRLKSDRFYGPDYTPEVYTQTGIDWVEHTTMSDILLRHYPGLRDALRGTTNAFAPWPGARA